MNEQYLLGASVFGVVSMLTWWITTVILGGEDGRVRQRLRNLSSEPRQAPGQRQSIMAILLRLGQLAASPFMPKDRKRQWALRRRLGHAGIYSPAAIRTVIGCKVVFLGAGFVAGYLIGIVAANIMLGLSLGGLAGYALPTIWLKQRIRKHQRALERGLPDALDLLVVCVEAGLTIDAAMQRVAQELALAHPRLARELEITHMETRVGLSRAEALKNLGQRTGCVSLQLLATMLIQADRFGTSVAQALRIQAETLRIQRQHRAEETAAKASVKLSFPVVLFIFPAVLIVLAGPAIIGLFKSALFAD
jgi:tight adherence protein C